jgi:hypothetical protein
MNWGTRRKVDRKPTGQKQAHFSTIQTRNERAAIHAGFIESPAAKERAGALEQPFAPIGLTGEGSHFAK